MHLARAPSVDREQREHRHHRTHEPDDDGDDDRAPEEEPEHERELDVADAHPGRREQRGDEQESAGPERREQVLGKVGEAEHGDEREPGGAEGQTVRSGMMR